MNPIRVFTVLLCLAGMMAIGCGDSGPPLGTVTGTVTMDGAPLSNVSVTFTPVEGGRSSTGTTDASGKYELVFVGKKGALVGQHEVAVRTISAAQGASSEAQASSDSAAYEAQAAGGAQSDYDAATTTEPIPAKYNTETELVKEVTSGGNTIDLELTSS